MKRAPKAALEEVKHLAADREVRQIGCKVWLWVLHLRRGDLLAVEEIW
jgi:hypothetical protein